MDLREPLGRQERALIAVVNLQLVGDLEFLEEPDNSLGARLVEPILSLLYQPEGLGQAA